jgi:hypothetical protein
MYPQNITLFVTCAGAVLHTSFQSSHPAAQARAIRRVFLSFHNGLTTITRVRACIPAGALLHASFQSSQPAAQA